MTRFDYQAIWDSLIQDMRARIKHAFILEKLNRVRIAKGGMFILSKSYQWTLKHFPSILNEYRIRSRVLSFDNLDLNDPVRMV